MILIENNHISMRVVYSLIFGFYASGFIFSEIILKRTKTDKRSTYVNVVCVRILFGDELSSLEIFVLEEVFFSRFFDGWFESEDEDFFSSHR